MAGGHSRSAVGVGPRGRRDVAAGLGRRQAAAHALPCRQESVTWESGHPTQLAVRRGSKQKTADAARVGPARRRGGSPLLFLSAARVGVGTSDAVRGARGRRDIRHPKQKTADAARVRPARRRGGSPLLFLSAARVGVGTSPPCLECLARVPVGAWRACESHVHGAHRPARVLATRTGAAAALRTARTSGPLAGFGNRDTWHDARDGEAWSGWWLGFERGSLSTAPRSGLRIARPGARLRCGLILPLHRAL